MLSNKKAFFVGLLIAPILCLSLLGGLSAAQSGATPQTNDTLDNYLQPNENPPVNITVPSSTPACQTRTLDIVAHEDDDILFMNPDLSRGLNLGDCVKTVYLTAGDDGQNSNYWMQREHGAEAAYSTMLKQPMDWQEDQAKIDDRWLVNTAVLKENPNVSLLFVRLPDGNLFGDGFASTNYESLQKLDNGQIDKLQAVDGQASYSLSDLTEMLANLIIQYQPDQVRTQANDYPDHSDHIAAGQLTALAYKQYLSQIIPIKSISLNFYHGYMVDQLPQNVIGDELKQKQDAFLEYANFDSAVCNNLEQCNNDATYGSYLTRQYQAGI